MFCPRCVVLWWCLPEVTCSRAFAFKPVSKQFVYTNLPPGLCRNKLERTSFPHGYQIWITHHLRRSKFIHFTDQPDWWCEVPEPRCAVAWFRLCIILVCVAGTTDCWSFICVHSHTYLWHECLVVLTSTSEVFEFEACGTRTGSAQRHCGTPLWQSADVEVWKMQLN